MNKLFHIPLFVLILMINVKSFGQIGCPSNYSSSIVKGPDSIQTHGDQTFRSLVVNPKNPNTVYVGTEGNGIFKSMDGGKTWKWKRKGLKHLMGDYPETYCIAINPEDTSELIMGVTIGPSNPLNTPAGIYMSNDGGESWHQRNCGITSASIALTWYDEQHPDTIFALSSGGYSSQGTPVFYSGGIFCSFDKGMNWFKVNMPANTDSCGAFRVVKHGNNVLVYLYNRPAGSSMGFIKSFDGGLNWTYLHKPLAGRTIAEYDATANLDEIYAVVRDSSIIYTSTDTGRTWLRKDFEINGLLSLDPLSNDTAFFDHGGTLVRCKNRFNTSYPGVDYTDVITVGRPIEKIVYAGLNSRIIYMSTRGYRIYKSTNGGHSFIPLVNLRDSIEVFQDTIPEVSIVHNASCSGSAQHFSILNNQPNYSITSCTWSGDNGLFNSFNTNASHIFSSNNGIGEFPISVIIYFDNGRSKTIYDTILIQKASVSYDSFSLNRSDTLFANFQNLGSIMTVSWNDLENGTLYYSSSNSFLPIDKLPNKNNINIVMNAQAIGGCFLIDTFQLTILNTYIFKKQNEDLHIYPNPSNNSFYISIPENSLDNMIKIFNINGEEIYNSKFIQGESISTENIPSGLYQIILKTSSTSYIGRFIKQ